MSSDRRLWPIPDLFKHDQGSSLRDYKELDSVYTVVGTNLGKPNSKVNKDLLCSKVLECSFILKANWSFTYLAYKPSSPS